jgi:phosphoserine phosphatase
MQAREAAHELRPPRRQLYRSAERRKERVTTIILSRHGHVEGIQPPRFRGRQALPLTEQGVAEAKMTASRIASSWRPAAIYTSCMVRCVATGAAIGEACHVRPIATQDLNDLHYGDWQWKTYDETQERWPELFKLWFSAPHFVRFPNGESLQDIVLRTADALRKVVEGFPNETVVLVGHDSTNRALLLQLLDQPLSAFWRVAQDPCAINLIEVENGGARVLSINDTGHLQRSGFTAASGPPVG